MSTPTLRKARTTRNTRAQMSDQESNTTDHTMKNDDVLMNDAPGSQSIQQAHGLPTDFNDAEYSNQNNNHHNRTRRSQSTMPIRDVKEETKPNRYNLGPRTSVHDVHDEGIRIMGKEVSLLQDAIYDLHRLGVDHVVPLPELVVVGDQSAGKSSLIGGLAEIHLPRSAGTCTRCPTFIKTTSSKSDTASWTCKVTLQRNFIHVPSHRGKLGPWKDCVPEETEFQTITDREDLDEVLKWAQIAVLNPSRDPRDYTPGFGHHLNSSYEVKFSPNLISLEISGPKLPSLSFYDLPGIIQNADESHLVGLVRNLVEYYIKRKDALILCALPMSSDPANSAAIHYVRKLKAENRCIGVLTKPDLLQDGELDSVWVPLLRGEKEGFKLGLKYYVTKQPVYAGEGPPKEHSEARAEEEFFFDTEPWSAELAEFRGRCGTKRLQMALSQALSLQIRDRLPSITAAIDLKASQIDAELDKLPELPDGDVQVAVLQQLTRFSMEVEKRIRGGNGYTKFQRDWKNLRTRFRDTVADMRPMTFTHDPLTESTAIPPNPRSGNDHPSTPSRREEIVEIKSDEEGDVNRISQSRFVNEENFATPRKVKGSRFNTPIKRKRESSPKNLPCKKPNISKGPDFNSCKAHTRKFSLQEIQDKIQEISTANYPGTVDPQVMTVLSIQSIEPWKIPLDMLTAATMTLMCTTISDTITEVLSCFSKTALYTAVMEQIHGFFNTIEIRQRERLANLLEVEIEEPMTLNKEIYNNNVTESLLRIQEKRREVRVKCYLDRQENITQKYTYDRQRTEKAAKVTEKDIGPDPFQTEVEVMSRVRGYYLTAYSRWVDNVCLSFQAQMFKDIQKSIHYYLENMLELHGARGNDTCRALMDEHPEVADHRKRLQSEKKKLELASNRLQRLAEDGEVYRRFAEQGKEDEGLV